MFLTRVMVHSQVKVMYKLNIIQRVTKRLRQKLQLQLNSYSFVFLAKASEKLYKILTISHGKTLTEETVLQMVDHRTLVQQKCKATYSFIVK